MTGESNTYQQLKAQIKDLKSAAKILGETGREIPTVMRNIIRIKASVKMLGLNIVDALEIEENDMSP